VVGRALGVDPTWSHHPVTEPGGVEVRWGEPPGSILSGPRIGVDYASAEDRAAPWRLAAAGSRAVARPRGLRPGLPEGREFAWRGSTSR
jgi:DNA-3-methyladenine glycosylase